MRDAGASHVASGGGGQNARVIPENFRSRTPLTPACRRLEVAAVDDLSPSLRRIRLAGDDAVGFSSPGPLDHVKLQVPGDDGVLVDPEADGEGRVTNRSELALRDMSIRAYDPDAGWIDIDVVRHEDGPLGRWAERAATGDAVWMLGPRGSKAIDDVFDWYLFACDLTALPSVARWCESLRSEARAIVLVDAPSPGDAIELTSPADLEVRWLSPDPEGGDVTRVLADELATLELPDGEGYIWAGGEAGSLRNVRAWAREAGIDPDRIDVSGYWKRGEAGFDHHAPIE